MPGPVLLIIMDGYGLGEAGSGNAIALARKPNLDRFFAEYPWAPLVCSGMAVGLPQGQMGNSEVGHLNMGAGRVVYQEFTRICRSIETGELFTNPVLTEAMDGAIAAGRAVHFIGLLSDGGVHSHYEHLYALVKMAADRGADRIFIHAFLDGRDVPPTSGLGFVTACDKYLRELGKGAIATVIGRYYAMDRDKRWERVEKAWRAMVLAEGATAGTAEEAVERSYAEGATDEFVLPTVVRRDGEPVARVEEGDALVFYNFRPDRAREITRAFVDPAFDGFARPAFPRVRFVQLTDYDPTIPAPVAFGKDLPKCVLADVIADAGLRQLHIAETEKYAHVTFFFNGGKETPKAGEERVLVPSPKVPTYDRQPEMSEPGVTEELERAIREGRADFYVVNYANCDMVGHTGDLEAAVKAVEAVDDGVGRIVAAVLERGGHALITSDHGNAERMKEPDGSPFTAHTTDKVPFIAVSPDVRGVRHGGMLADVAPSVLELMGIEQPDEWTGRSLLEP